jgi:predicted nucleic acid-binding Zn ribbon protein
MKRKDSTHINEVLKDYIKALGVEDKLKEAGLINSWEKLVGKMVAKSTRKIEINKGIMYVHLNSSIVRNELMMIRNELLKRLNENAGSELIKEIVLM